MEKIKYLIMDVDGTLTDGKIYMGNDGEVCKAFHIKDGYGISNIAIPAGIIPIIITGRTSKIVENRCKELGIYYLYQGVKEKIKKVRELTISKKGQEFAYIGDDINDLSSMLFIKKIGGVIGCPANAVKEIKDISDFISSKNGGDGAVREFIEWVLKNSD